MQAPDASVRAQLERLYRRSPTLGVGVQFQRFFRSIWQALHLWATGDRRQPQVWRYFDAQGRVIWHAYDPVSGERLTSRSEAELLDWLEDRYGRPFPQG